MLRYRLCSTFRWTSLGRAPETSDPHGSFPVGVEWSWVIQNWVSPVLPTWALKGSLVQLSCTSLGKADTEGTPEKVVGNQAIPVVDLYTVTATLGHPPALRFCQRSRKGTGGLLWCWWKLLLSVSAACVFLHVCFQAPQMTESRSGSALLMG